MLFGICRETGADDGSIGVRRCLASLAATPMMACREWYEQQIRQHGHQDLGRLGSRSPGRRIRRLRRTGPAVHRCRTRQARHHRTAGRDQPGERLYHQTIAHGDDNPSRVPAGPPVTRAELDAALDAVGDICKKYCRLCHPGEALGALTPLKSLSWIQIFQTAWMPPGFTLPDDLDCEPAAKMW